MTSDNIDAGSAATSGCESPYCKCKSVEPKSQQLHDTTSFSFPFLEGGGARVRLGELAAASRPVYDASRLVPLSPVGDDTPRRGGEAEGLLGTEEFARTKGFVGDWGRPSKCF